MKQKHTNIFYIINNKENMYKFLNNRENFKICISTKEIT